MNLSRPERPEAAAVPVVVVVATDADLTECRPAVADWSRQNPLRPFTWPSEIRVQHVPPPMPFVPPPDLRPQTVRNPAGHGAGQRLLVVDDKWFYRDRFREFFIPRGFDLHVVATAAEALALIEIFGVEYFHAVVSDVSMEFELSGLYLVRQLRVRQFPGSVILASTGFDNYFAVMVSQWLLPLQGVHWLMPKRALKAQRPRFIRCRGLL